MDDRKNLPVHEILSTANRQHTKTESRKFTEKKLLYQQLGQHAGVVHVAVRHQHGAHLPGFRVQRQVYLAPAAPFAVAVLAHFPLALAKELQPGAVHQQMHRLARLAQHRQCRPQRLGPSAQRAV